MHNKWYSQLLFPTRSRKWIKLIFWLAITDITVYKWILKWVEWMDSRSRSITTCSLIVTRHLLKYSLNNATFDYSKQFERNTKKKKKESSQLPFPKRHFNRQTYSPPSIVVKYSTYRVHFRYLSRYKRGKWTVPAVKRTINRSLQLPQSPMLFYS